MVKEMLDFGKPLHLDATKTNINDLIKESLAVAQPTAKEVAVALEADLAPSLPAFSVDAAKIKQVVLNLITNAVQASPAGWGELRGG
jgi:signal transduction histidine kinase